ncbi:hypothetical protein WJX72_001498 [[Myrmecia] bisecta]|uniref:Peptidase S54 rhomboid domain-containing protein n=1 Tax=[Myrmecia] bisecta TaxID=41462 RepID=A0AAW1QED0_9CHLO
MCCTATQCQKLSALVQLGAVSTTLSKLASLSLAGACFASSVATSFGGAGKPVRRGSTRRSLQEFGAPARRVTDVLLVVNTAVFGLQLLSNGSLLALGCKLNPGIAAGEWWRLVTPALLHANLMHLAFNQMALNNLGPTVEAFSGRQRFATVYVASAVMGNVFSYYCSKSPAVGASGAIFGIGGALAVFFYRHRDYFGSASDSVLQSLGQSLALNIVLGLTTRNIDQWAHLGGLVAGAATSFLLGPHLVTEQETKPRGKTQRVLVDRPPLGDQVKVTGVCKTIAMLAVAGQDSIWTRTGLGLLQHLAQTAALQGGAGVSQSAGFLFLSSRGLHREVNCFSQ